MHQRTITTTRQHSIKNRDRWTITNIGTDGSILASRVGKPAESVRLPANYVQQHVELGYAQTSHAAQGRTVDHALLVLDTPTNSPGIYVALTRGRTSNTVYVTAPDHPTALDTIKTAVTNQWIDQPARVRQHELAAGPRLPGQLPAAEITRLQQRQDELANIINNARPELAQTRRQLKQLTTERPAIAKQLDTAQSQLADAQGTLDAYDRPLHRRKHRNTIDEAKKTVADLPSKIAGFADDLAAIDRAIPELTDRIGDLEAAVEQIPDLTNEHHSSTERLSRCGDNSRSGRPMQGIESAHDLASPNQDLLDALDRVAPAHTDELDLGLGL